MNYQQVQTLRQVITHGSLKPKPLTGEQSVNFFNFRKELTAFFDNALEIDKSIMESEAVTADNLGQFEYPKDGSVDPKEFQNKILEARKSQTLELKNKNFIDRKEFLLWVAEVDIETASTLAEYLLKTE